MQQNDDTRALEAYLGRVRPVYHQVFNLAHAVTGSCEAAEYCVQCAMLECWAADEDGSSHHGFREALRRSALRAAYKCDPDDFDWDGLQFEGEDDPICRLIAQEGADLRRMLALRYGCRLSPGRIAWVCGEDASRVRGMLRRFDARMRRRLPKLNPRKLESQIEHAVRRELTQPTLFAPDMGNVFRSFQADAASTSRPSRLPARILRVVFAAVLAVLCIGAFWFAAVLLQPPVLEEPVGIVEVQE